MITIKIAEAFVEIKGDKVKLSKTLAGAKMETTRFAKSAIKALKGVSIGLAAVGAAAVIASIAIGVKLLRSLIDVTKAAANFGDSLDKMSLRTGETVETLSGLGFAAEISGSSIQDLENGIRRLSRNMNDTARGIGEARRSFEQMDISVQDSEGNLRAASDVMAEVADKMRDLGSESEKTAIAQELFGRGGAALLPLLKEGSVGMKRLTDQAADLGLIMTTKATKAAAAFNDRLTEMNATIKMVKVNIGTALMPVLTPLIERLRDLSAAASKGLGNFSETIINAIDSAGGLSKFWELHGKLVKAIFQDMATTGVKLVGIMFSGISDIMQNIGIVAWEWYANRFKETWRAALEDATNRFLLFADGSRDRLAKDLERREQDQKGFDARSALQIIKMQAIQEAAFDSINAVVANTYEEASAEVAAFVERYKKKLAEIETTTKKVISAAGKAVPGGALGALQSEADLLKETLRLAKLAQDALNERPDTPFTAFRPSPGTAATALEDRERLNRRLAFIDEEERAEAERIGASNKAAEDLKIRDEARFRNLPKLWTGALLKVKQVQAKHIAAITSEWAKFTISLQSSFSNTFADMLSKGELSWAKFAKNLKNIFIRQLSEIAVSAAFRGIGNLFDNLTANDFSSSQPAHANVGGIFGGDEPPPFLAPAAGAQQAPSINIIMQNDMRHMSSAEVEQIVQSKIQPAIRNLMKRGIIASRA